MTWADVDWDKGRMLVRSSKTEHHAGKATRMVPIFPELRPHLQRVFDEAAAGELYVITRYRQRNANLRTQFQKMIARAGFNPWPRLFQNLRSSRQTELADQFPAHVVCAWIGNSEVVARDHYLQVTDAHYGKAVGGGAEATQKATQKPAAMRRNESQTESPPESKPPENANIAGFPGNVDGATRIRTVNQAIMSGLL